MKKTYKKIKSNSPTSDKIVSTNDSNNKPTMTIKISSTNEKIINNEKQMNMTKKHVEKIEKIKVDKSERQKIRIILLK